MGRKSLISLAACFLGMRVTKVAFKLFSNWPLETYTFLKGKQDNKWCSFKKFDFSNRTKKVKQREYFLLVRTKWIY